MPRRKPPTAEAPDLPAPPQIPRVGYKVTEVAEMLGLTRQTVYNLIRRGEIRPFRPGGATRISADEVERLVKRTTGAPSTRGGRAPRTVAAK